MESGTPSRDTAWAISRRIFTVLIVSAALFALPAAAVKQSDNVPPRATLHAAGKVQKGKLWSYGWSRPASPTGCVGTNADGVLRYGRGGLSIGPRKLALEISFAKPQKPLGVAVSLWTSIDADGNPVGQARSPRHRLRKRITGATHHWVVRLKKLFVSGDIYLDVFGRWPSNGCAGGDASWSFHVRP